MTSGLPMVSCVMPTANRRAFVPHAVVHFLEQDYPARELVVIDDGADPIGDLLPESPSIRYHRPATRLLLGAKRNLGCELARGEIVVHWDDDDWMAPWRVSTQVAVLSGGGVDVCGLRTLLFHDASANRSWRYTYPAGAPRPWVAGATMAYRRAFWQDNRFPDLRSGEDTRFLWSARPKHVLALDDDSWYVASIHPGNTSVKRPVGSRWRAVPVEEVHARSRAASTPSSRAVPSVVAPATVAIGVHVHAQPEGLRATLAKLAGGPAAGARVVVIPDHPDRETRTTLAAQGEVEILPEPGAVGAAACLNRLVGSVDADIYVLLESGATGAPGWLSALLAAFDRPQVGLAGPSTNRSWNEQQAVAACTGTARSLNSAAGLVQARYRGAVRSLAPLHSLAEFCYAVRREVFDTAGPADEAYGRGPCWEMDYNVKALRHGFAGVWATGSFVHRRPFTPVRQRAEDELFLANKHRYQDKYCGARLRGTAATYQDHCRGEACGDFAPVELIVPGGRPTPATDTSVARGLAMVSCIMPTAGRPDWVARAVELFARQAYPSRELVIIADTGGDDLPPGVVDGSASIRVLRVPRGTTIGAKRNLGCAAATGEIVAHWDDDDWYGADRLARQVAPIDAGDTDVTALYGGVYLDLPSWEFWSPTPQLHTRMFRHDVHGGTLAYRRSLWQRGMRYPATSLAEDATFLDRVLRSGARLTRLPAESDFLYVRHGANSWRFVVGQGAGWQRQPEPRLPPEDRSFYLRRRAAGDHAAEEVRRVAARR